MARILLAKLGTDAHENGVIVVAKWLRDAGHEVTYSGLYKTPAQLAEIAKAERPDVIGVSFLASEPVFLSARLLEELAEAGLDDIPLVVGGVVTPAMAEALREMGIEAIFTPGARREAILDGIAGAVAGEGRNLP
jgi:methylmalonyl-CoA mutase C-terminal domain/subunit